MKFALVGCGRVSGRHFESISALEGAELCGVCDIDATALNKATSEYGVPGYESMEAMLLELKPDVVALATPSGLHPEQTILAAKHGCHIICEKPMATRWSDAQRMIGACENANVRLFIVKQHRFNPAVELVKEAIDDGRLGRIYDAHVSVFWTRPQDYYDLAEWRGTWELDGGALMNQAIHYVDLLRWLVGPVESVFAHTATLARRIEVEDTAAVGLKFRSGALGTINVTMLCHPQNLEASVTLLGEKGTLRLGGVACNHIAHWDVQGEETPVSEPQDGGLYGIGHPRFYRDVYNAIKDGHTGRLEGVEGLKALEVVMAAYRSSQEGKRIALPFEP